MTLIQEPVICVNVLGVFQVGDLETRTKENPLANLDSKTHLVCVLCLECTFQHLMFFPSITQLVSWTNVGVNTFERYLSPLFFLKRFYLFMHDRHTERGRDIGRGKSRLPVESPMWDSIPGPQGHDLSQRQMLNLEATQVPLYTNFKAYHL